MDELDPPTMTGPVLLDLPCLFLCLELFLLLDLLLQHLLESLVILSLAEHPRPLLGTDIPPKVLFFLLLAEGYAVGDESQLILELPSALAKLSQADGLELLGEEELTAEGVGTYVETGGAHRG